jgi:hypothetical protein
MFQVIWLRRERNMANPQQVCEMRIKHINIYFNVSTFKKKKAIPIMGCGRPIGL